MAGLNEHGHGTWDAIAREVLTPRITRQVVHGDALTMAKLFMKKGAFVATHSHPNEQFTMILSGRLLFRYGERLEYEAEVGPAGSCICPRTCRTTRCASRMPSISTSSRRRGPIGSNPAATATSTPRRRATDAARPAPPSTPFADPDSIEEASCRSRMLC